MFFIKMLENRFLLFSFSVFQILTIAVLSILITAPLGAILIALLGPHLLQMCKLEKETGSTERSKQLDIPQQEQETLMGVG